MTKRNRSRSRKRNYDRPVATKSAEKTFLIVCEGSKTEPNYFKSFPVLSASVEIHGTGRNTLSLVHYAEEIRDNRAEEFDEIWLVFDKDSFPAVNFNNAIAFCLAHYDKGFRVAYSNEAFELWYLLHYELIKRPVSRFDYEAMLTRLMKKRYKKNNPNLYNKLLSRQPLAIEHAKTLYAKRSNSPAKDNPSTTVFQLVEELNKHLRD